MKNKIFTILSNKIVQICFITFYLVAFGSFVGYGDIIQHYGYCGDNDYFMGGLIKLAGLSGIYIFMFIFYKYYYTPIDFNKINKR
jgi:hypothetical protein